MQAQVDKNRRACSVLRVPLYAAAEADKRFVINYSTRQY